MAAPAAAAVATTTTGGRFDNALGADDPAALKAAVRSGVYETCKGQLYDEVQLLRPLIASGSDAELGVALHLTSFALAGAAAAVADLMPHCRDSLGDSIHHAGLVLAAMQRYPPERGRMQGQLLVASLHAVGECPRTSGTGSACGRPIVIGRLRRQASSMAWLHAVQIPSSSSSSSSLE